MVVYSSLECWIEPRQVIYGKAGQVERECEALTYLGEVIFNWIITGDYSIVGRVLNSVFKSEVSLENANFEQAREDLSACLSKRMKSMPSDSRYRRTVLWCKYEKLMFNTFVSGPSPRLIISLVSPRLTAPSRALRRSCSAKSTTTLRRAWLRQLLCSTPGSQAWRSWRRLRTSPRSWPSWISYARRSRNVLPTTRRCKKAPTRRTRTLCLFSKVCNLYPYYLIDNFLVQTPKWSRRLASRKWELQPSSRWCEAIALLQFSLGPIVSGIDCALLFACPRHALVTINGLLIFVRTF